MIDLYTFPTPNGHKVSIMLEELGLEYETHIIDITKEEQFRPEFLKISPNNKIPAIYDRSENLSLFESVAILTYLAEKHDRFLPARGRERYETIQWCYFQAAHIGPMFGQYGHFHKYAPVQIAYAKERYEQESKRLLTVMNYRLRESDFMAGKTYSIADIATFPWIAGYMNFYGSSIEGFPYVQRWFQSIAQRDAVKKGMKVPQR